MKRSELKELIKKSMLEVAPKEDSGAMTPEEEKMVADYEEEEANKYALDKEEPMEEAMVSPDNRVDYLANALDHVWKMGKGNNTTDFTSLAKSLVGDMFDDETIEEGSITLDPEEVYNEYSSLFNQYRGEGMDKLSAIEAAQSELAQKHNTTPLIISQFLDSYWNDQYMNDTYADDENMLREADEIVAAWAQKQTLNEADLSQANFSDLHQVVKNIAHVNEVGMEEAAMLAIEFIAEQFDVPVDFKEF
jgi:hypothetical protein